MPKKDIKNKKISCDVDTCIHNNTYNCCCNLDEIKVSCNCSENNATKNSETICESFECNCASIDKAE